MTEKNAEKDRARALVDLTGWSYSRCLQALRKNLTADAFDALLQLEGVKRKRCSRSHPIPGRGGYCVRAEHPATSRCLLVGSLRGTSPIADQGETCSGVGHAVASALSLEASGASGEPRAPRTPKAPGAPGAIARSSAVDSRGRAVPREAEVFYVRKGAAS